MRRLFTTLGLALLVAYGAYPYVALYQLDQAVSTQDEAALDRLVDWESLRDHLEADLEGLFEQAKPSEDDVMGNIAQGLFGIFADLMIDPVVNFYTTPRGLAYLLNTQVILEDPSEVLENDFPAEDTWVDHISFAFFADPGHFRATVRYPEESSGKRSSMGPMVLEFRLQDFRWQLTWVRLPLDDITRRYDGDE